MINLFVNTSSTVGTQDGTTNTPGSSGTAAFATLRQAIDSLGTLSDATTIFCDGSGGKDTGDIAQGPWDFVTSATNYLLITAVGSMRANAVWNDNAYIISGTNKSPGMFYQNTPCHVRVDGIQMEHIVNDGSSGKIIFKSANANQTLTGIDMRLSHSLLRGVATNGSTITGIDCRPFGVGGTGRARHWDVIVYGCSQCFTNDLVDGAFYNCTAASGTFNFIDSVGNTMVVINCLSTGAVNAGFVGPFQVGSDYNAEDDGNGAPGAHSRGSQVFSFVDAANKNYRLTKSDTGARDWGVTDPGGEGFVTDDIDGNIRSGLWDIGASEFIPVPSRKINVLRPKIFRPGLAR